jgi:hypothetical protein
MEHRRGNVFSGDPVGKQGLDIGLGKDAAA